MDDIEQQSPQSKVVPGMVTLVLSEALANKVLETIEAAQNDDDDVSGYMLNMGIGASTKLNENTQTLTSPCNHTNVGNGDLNCDVDEWIQY